MLLASDGMQQSQSKVTMPRGCLLSDVEKGEILALHREF